MKHFRWNTGIFLLAWGMAWGGESPASEADPCELKVGDAEIGRLADFAGEIAAHAGGIKVAIEVREKSCEAIDRAVHSLPPEGGRIRLVAGTYMCAHPVVIDRNNVDLAGAGQGRTILKAFAGKPVPLLVIGSIRNTDHNQFGVPYPDRVTRNVSVSGLTVDGNYHTHPNPKSVECWDPVTAQSNNCLGDSTSIRNNGLTVRRAEDIKVNDFGAIANYSGGIVTEKYCKNLLMDNFTVADNFYDGFAGYETTASVFRNFHANGNHYSGLSADIDFKGNIFEGGEMRGNHDNGLFSHAVSANIYRNLEVHGNDNWNYYFDGQREKDHEEVIIPGFCNDNRIEGGSMSGSKGGIFIHSSCRNFQVDHATMSEPGRPCFLFDPGSEVKISGNTTCDDGGQSGARDGIYESGRKL
jgi:hypothetical protein